MQFYRGIFSANRVEAPLARLPILFCGRMMNFVANNYGLVADQETVHAINQGPFMQHHLLPQIIHRAPQKCHSIFIVPDSS